eukprot:jgi/Ulvmu1/3895/UM018_0116.1
MNARRHAALLGVDPDRGRRERKNNIVNARANAREERLNHRRRLESDDPAQNLLFAQDSNVGGAVRSLEDLSGNVTKLMSDNTEHQLEATSYFRKLLSIEKRPPIEEVVRQPGVVRRLVEFLGYDHNQKLQFEAAWALTNIASGTTQHTRYVIECGAIPIFVRILMSPSEEVREQAVWALGNIAGDHPTTRDMVLGAGALQPLLQLLSPEVQASRSMVRNATWTLSNFCRGKPAPNFEITKHSLPTLRALIMPQNGEVDDEIMTDACWALSYLSDGPNERIQAVIHANICLRLVELLSYEKDTVLVPALRTVGNIVTGTDEQTQAIINCQALTALYSILVSAQHHKKSIIKEACWTVSNITAGTREQIAAVIDSGCIDPIVNLLRNGELEIKREAAWAISNATSGGDPTQIQQLVQYGCIPPLCDLLRVMDPRVVQVALEGLKNILSAAEKLRSLPGSNGENVYAVILEDAGGLDLLENLQNHSSDEISAKAVEILSTFFEVLPEDENAVPVVDSAGMFNFTGQGMDTSGNSDGQTSFNFGGL